MNFINLDKYKNIAIDLHPMQTKVIWDMTDYWCDRIDPIFEFESKQMNRIIIYDNAEFELLLEKLKGYAYDKCNHDWLSQLTLLEKEFKFELKHTVPSDVPIKLLSDAEISRIICEKLNVNDRDLEWTFANQFKEREDLEYFLMVISKNQFVIRDLNENEKGGSNGICI